MAVLDGLEHPYSAIDVSQLGREVLGHLMHLPHPPWEEERHLQPRRVRDGLTC